ncbi:UDP-glucose 4-epimerase family protein [Aeromonas caviae]|uniref:UDP-glucose 4-epimerase family protein n=1 Tax=Aeromonas caviae TaxID=648 RepID=UPI002447433F|nr:SDR family oxidoreductase [Aeromonas caviae]MDH0238981.1 SDR family oxidoreductase [Aeromonas caviae]
MLDAYRVLVTGANGFVGCTLFKYLHEVEQYHVSGSVRTADTAQKNLFTVGELSENTNWSEALEGQHVVIHVAARAHVMDEAIIDPLTEYRRVNVAGTSNLARQAANAGVKRFIFISSIKVNGESTAADSPFQHIDKAMPEDLYGISKAEAEDGLWQIGKETGMEIVIIRPPLVYGPGVKANFASMMKWASKNLPLPLGAVCNSRSLVALDNLISLIVTCIDHPKAANQTFLVSDDRDVSTTQLLRMMAHAFGKKARLLPIPMSWIRGVASLLGKKAVADRLCGSLQVDITYTKETLGWKPPVTMEQQLAKIVASMSSPRDV